MAMRKAMRSYACGVTSNALGWLHAFPGDHAVSRLHAPWGDMKLPLYVGFNRLVSGCRFAHETKHQF